MTFNRMGTVPLPLALHLAQDSRPARVRIFDPVLPADFGHSALTDGEAEAGAFVGTFCRKKGIEDAAADLPGNARPRVVHRQPHPSLARLRAELHDRGLPAPHHILRVRHEIDDHLLQLLTQAQDGGSGLVERGAKLHALRAQHALADLGHVVYQVVHLHARRGRVGAPGEAQQAAHDTRGTVHLAGDGGRRGAGVGILAGAAQQLGLHPDRRERIVHLVRHTAGDLAHRGELLTRDQLALRAQLERPGHRGPPPGGAPPAGVGPGAPGGGGGGGCPAPGGGTPPPPPPPATPLDVRSGAIIAARAMPEGDRPRWPSPSVRMLSVRKGSPVRITRPVALSSIAISAPSSSTHCPTVEATRSGSGPAPRHPTYAPWASTRLVTLWSV